MYRFLQAAEALEDPDVEVHASTLLAQEQSARAAVVAVPVLSTTWSYLTVSPASAETMANLRRILVDVVGTPAPSIKAASVSTEVRVYAVSLLSCGWALLCYLVLAGRCGARRTAHCHACMHAHASNAGGAF